jgi:hypothetical protein
LAAPWDFAARKRPEGREFNPKWRFWRNRPAQPTCAGITTVVMRMQELLSDDPAAELLEDAPLGQYLVERRGVWLLLWRQSEGEPPDGALEPAADWALVPA